PLHSSSAPQHPPSFPTRRSSDLNYTDRIKNVHQARHLVRKSPHCKRAIDLYLYYVLGSQFRPSLVPIIEDYDDLKESDEKKHKKDRKSTRLNSSHVKISYAVFCL